LSEKSLGTFAYAPRSATRPGCLATVRSAIETKGAGQMAQSAPIAVSRPPRVCPCCTPPDSFGLGGQRAASRPSAGCWEPADQPPGRSAKPTNSCACRPRSASWRRCNVGSGRLASPRTPGPPAVRVSTATEAVETTDAAAMAGRSTAPSTRISRRPPMRPRSSTRIAPVPPSGCGGLSIGSHDVKRSWRVAATRAVKRTASWKRSRITMASGKAAR